MRLKHLIPIVMLAVGPAHAAPISGTFNYQGRLTSAGAPITGNADVRFSLWDDEAAGFQVGSTIEFLAVPLTDGLFAADLNFGVVAFNGDKRWLEIEARSPAGVGSYTTLGRQQILATPYATYATYADQTHGITVDSALNVGIGTTTPSARLEVAGPSTGPLILAANGWYAIRGSHNTSTGSFPGVWGDTDSNSSGANGIRGIVNSTSPGSGSAGVCGINNGTNANGSGVYGTHAGAGIGVYGEATRTASGASYGVRGVARTWSGIGVHGVAANSSFGANNYGGWFTSNGDGNGAGLYAEQTGGGTAYGVFAIQEGTANSNYGVWGQSRSSVGTGIRGHASATSGTNYGVRGSTSSPSGYGVYSSGDFGGTGAKYFIQPHPTDPAKEIRFVCLEGNEAGTYFRGTSKLVGGRAYIAVPEEFRHVSEPDGITVQVTALGRHDGIWVESRDLDIIVVAGNTDVEFDYFVNGVRRGFKDVEIVRDNAAFVPEVRGVPFAPQLRPAVRRLLVDTGVLNPDFTPNEQTAARIGWKLRDPRPHELAQDPAPVLASQ